MIYFIQQGEAGPIKIGYSEAPDRRRVSLQAAHSEVLGGLVDPHLRRAPESLFAYGLWQMLPSRRNQP